MNESKVILEWTREAREDAETGVHREYLLQLARSWLKDKMTKEDTDIILTQKEAAVLFEWFKHAFDTRDYAEFRAMLRR